MRSIVAWADKGWAAIIVVLVCLYGVMLVPRAQSKPFWHDEVYTILESQLSPITLYRADLDGLDLAPPLAPLMTKVSTTVAGGPGRISVRAPQMLGFVMACLITFVIVRRRANAIVGLTAALIPLFTPAVDFACEARGYGLTLCFFALALYGWLEAASGRRVRMHLWLMAAALSAGVWAHTFAVLAFVPIAAGEAVRQAGLRRFDRAPWIAMAAACASLLPLVPLLIAGASQASDYWTRTIPFGVHEAYTFLTGRIFADRSLVGLEIAGVLAGVEALRQLRGRRTTRRFERHEIAAGLIAVALPAIGVLVGVLNGGIITGRYLMLCITGFAVVLPLLAWRFTPDNGLADLLLCLALVTGLVKSTGRALRRETVVATTMERFPQLAGLLKGSDPVVITGGVEYLALWYEAAPDERPRAVYLASPARELAQQHEATIDRGYLALARWTPVAVVSDETFLPTHNTFRVYSFEPDWLIKPLKASGAVVRETGRDGDARLYEVQVR